MAGHGVEGFEHVAHVAHNYAEIALEINMAAGPLATGASSYAMGIEWGLRFAATRPSQVQALLDYIVENTDDGLPLEVREQEFEEDFALICSRG